MRGHWTWTVNIGELIEEKKKNQNGCLVSNSKHTLNESQVSINKVNELQHIIKTVSDFIDFS